MLDNFEHVLSAAPLCAALLGACPHAKALVTSRAALNLRGEQVVAVPPLPVPDLGQLPPFADLERYGAVALFVERARAARPDFTLGGPERGQLVAAICGHLNGLPLAIELAAAHVRHFTLEELAMRLEGAAALDLLVGGPRDLADHQRTMRSTVAWSYSLLSPDEQRVFRALGVFAGGASVEGIRRVVGLADRQEEMREDTVAACLLGLVDANLARGVEPQGEHGNDNGNDLRYDLLVIVRAFALEQLREEGELETARHRLADYIVGLVEQVDPIAANVQTAPLNRLMCEHDNLRCVLEWLLERGEVLVGLRLGYHLRPFWESRGLVAEGAAWLERLLAQAQAPGTPNELGAQVDAWKVLVVMRYRLGHFQQAAEAAEQALALTRQQGDPGKVAQALHYLANPLCRLGEFDRAEALLLERLAFDRAAGHQTDEMIDLINLADLRMYQGRYQEAVALEEEALALSRSLAEHDPSLPLILASLGEIYILMDRPEEARDILRESQRVFEARDERVTMGLYNLGRASWRLGAFAEALVYLNQATQRSRRQDDVTMQVQELCVVVGIALDQGNLSLAGQALNEAIATQVRVSDQRVRWRVVERAAGYVCRLGAWEIAIRLYNAAAQGRSYLHDLVDPAERELRAQDRATALVRLGPDTLAAMEHIDDALMLPQALEMVGSALKETRPE
ncbi:MAG TPA: tetratricopeptide repeat protein [Ktedonobacterales bacterium]|nr:tetratricopeptide repeat protein [Ktedonobacterales bacterium]